MRTRPRHFDSDGKECQICLYISSEKHPHTVNWYACVLGRRSSGWQSSLWNSHADPPSSMQIHSLDHHYLSWISHTHLVSVTVSCTITALDSTHRMSSGSSFSQDLRTWTGLIATYCLVTVAPGWSSRLSLAEKWPFKVLFVPWETAFPWFSLHQKITHSHFPRPLAPS